MTNVIKNHASCNNTEKDERKKKFVLIRHLKSTRERVVCGQQRVVYGDSASDEDCALVAKSVTPLANPNHIFQN